jgi:hypothetical protein
MAPDSSLLVAMTGGKAVAAADASIGQTHLPCEVSDGLLDMQVRNFPMLFPGNP